METAPEMEDADQETDPSTESLLEALLVADAEVVWDPVTGRPNIVLAQKDSCQKDSCQKILAKKILDRRADPA